MTSRVKRIAVPALLLMALLLAWHFASSSGLFNSYVLPSPQKVWRTAWKMISGGELMRDVTISVVRVLKGFGITFALAIVLATIAALLPGAAVSYEWLLGFFKHVPPISLIPLLILWLGIGEATKTTIIVMASFFPMYLSMLKGLTGCDEKLLEVGRAFGYGKARSFLSIVLPSSVPDILLGMRTSLGYSWRAIIGAEMVAASTGLGHLILLSQEMSRTDKVIVGIFAIGAVGWLTDALLGRLIRRMVGGKAGNGWN